MQQISRSGLKEAWTTSIHLNQILPLQTNNIWKAVLYFTAYNLNWNVQLFCDKSVKLYIEFAYSNTISHNPAYNITWENTIH